MPCVARDGILTDEWAMSTNPIAETVEQMKVRNPYSCSRVHSQRQKGTKLLFVILETKSKPIHADCKNSYCPSDSSIKEDLLILGQESIILPSYHNALGSNTTVKTAPPITSPILCRKSMSERVSRNALGRAIDGQTWQQKTPLLDID